MNMGMAEMGSIEKTAITILEVAGGFLIGFLLTGVLARLVGKMLLQAPGPGRIARLAKVAGGAAGAIAVYLLLSGDSGFGFGGKGGGRPLLTSDGKEDAKTKTKEEKREEEPKKIDVKAKEEELRGSPVIVYVLGADAPNNRYFRFEDEPQPLTVEEIVQRIGQLEKAGKLKNKFIRLKAGAENISAPQYGKIYSTLRAEFEPRGFEIIPLTIGTER